MNITQDTEFMAQLLKEAEQKDKTTAVEPQSCAIDDEDGCASCGSQDMTDEKRDITIWNEDLNIEITYSVPEDVFRYIVGLEGEVSDLIEEADLAKDAFSELAVAWNRNSNMQDPLHIN